MLLRYEKWHGMIVPGAYSPIGASLFIFSHTRGGDVDYLIKSLLYGLTRSSHRPRNSWTMVAIWVRTTETVSGDQNADISGFTHFQFELDSYGANQNADTRGRDYGRFYF